MQMTDDINRIIKCLTLSVHENEIKNLESLSWAINKLENFSMTFETLDKSRIGQTLQSVRHSRKISVDISGRIRNLIKCWRQLLNVDCLSVTPNAMKMPAKEQKEPLNGIVKNGIVKETVTNCNGFSHDNEADNVNEVDNGDGVDGNYFKPKRKPDKDDKEQQVEEQVPPIATDGHDECEQTVENVDEANVAAEDTSVDGGAEPPKTRISEDNPLKMVFSFPQIGKPKLKSTKELLADFCSLINADTKNKILMDKITQEDDDPAAYHPQEFRHREMLQHQLLMQGQAAARMKSQEVLESEEDEDEGDDDDVEVVMVVEPNKGGEGPPEGQAEVRDREPAEPQQDRAGKENELVTEPSPAPQKLSNCDQLLRKFQALCPDQPSIVFRQLVPWTNMEKRGIDCSAPTIRPTKAAKRALAFNGVPSATGEPPNKISITEIDDLLQTFETRAQRKAMITEAICRRKEESQFADNTQSLTDVSLKLKLKLQQPLVKLRKRKIRRRKKKRKLKKLKKKAPPAPPKPRVRKPRIKPKPPITNYLDDIPPLTELTESLLAGGPTESSPPPPDCAEFPFSDENVNKLVNGTMVEGRNCTKHSQTMELLDFRTMYSLLVGHEYLHVFPWVDLHYDTKSGFPTESDQMLQSALELPQLFS